MYILKKTMLNFNLKTIMKKIIFIVSLSLLCLASKAQVCYDTYTLKQINCNKMDLTFSQAVFEDIEPLITVAKFDSLNSVGFTALSKGKLVRITDTLIGADDTGRLFRSSVNSLPFKYKSWQPHWDSISNKPTLNISNWNTAYSWGDHAGLYRSSSWVPSWTDVTSKPTFHTVATSGNYNDLSNKPTITSYTAGTGIGISSGVITNSAPDQTVSITGGNGITATGTYPNFTVSKTKREEVYTVTTSSTGSGATATVTFGTSYSVPPVIVPVIQNEAINRFVRAFDVTTTGCTIHTWAINLLSLGTSNAGGITVDVLVTER